VGERGTDKGVRNAKEEEETRRRGYGKREKALAFEGLFSKLKCVKRERGKGVQRKSIDRRKEGAPRRGGKGGFRLGGKERKK